MSPVSQYHCALRRELGLLEVTLTGIGIIVGAGIYALLGEAASLAGNAVWIAFAISAVMAVFTGLSYAELTSMFPKAGAEYDYVNAAAGKQIAFTVSWLVIVNGILAAATVALSFGNYFRALFEGPPLLIAFIFVILCGGLLFWGIRETAWFTIAFTLVELGGIVVLVLAGLPYIGSVNYFQMPFGWSGVFQASALVFFAYTGFEGIVKLAEETKEPERTIPRGLILAISITIVLYILASIAAVSVMGWQGISGSKSPFADVIREALGTDAFHAMGVIALCATANTALIALLATTRLVYGMAVSQSFPAIFARIDDARRTPWVAIVVITIVTAASLVIGDLVFVANLSNFTLFVTFIVINVAVVILRIRAPAEKRPFRIPWDFGGIPVIPVLGALFCLFLLAQQTGGVLFLGVVLMVAGVLLSFFFQAGGGDRQPPVTSRRPNT